MKPSIKHYVYIVPIAGCIALMLLFSAVLAHYADARSGQLIERQSRAIDVIGDAYLHIANPRKDEFLRGAVRRLSDDPTVNYILVDSKGIYFVGDVADFNPLSDARIREKIIPSNGKVVEPGYSGFFEQWDGLLKRRCYFKWISSDRAVVVGVSTPLNELLPLWYEIGLIVTVLAMVASSVYILGDYLARNSL